MTDRMVVEMSKYRVALAKELKFVDAEIWLGPPEGFPLATELASADVGDVLEKHFCTQSGVLGAVVERDLT